MAKTRESSVAPETGNMLVLLLPEEIVIEDQVSTRPFSGISINGNEVEVDTINDLAATIEKEGQLQPIVVRMSESDNGGGDSVFKLIAGRRRVEAIRLINAAKSKDEDPLKVRCVVEYGINDKRAVRQALIENIHRKNPSPIQFALTLRQLKDDGMKPKQIADFLQVSAATITQHLKLLDLPEAVQQKVHSGQLSTGSAFDVLDTGIPESEREQVVDEAREIQGDDKPIKRKNVRKAAREHGAVKTRNRSDIVEFFESLNGSAYGGADGAVRQFLTYFTESWCVGTGTDRTLMTKFDAMVEGADRGTEEAEELEPAKKIPAKKKKSARKKK